jgi:Sulfatase-modifying factor enzyme 1
MFLFHNIELPILINNSFKMVSIAFGQSASLGWIVRAVDSMMNPGDRSKKDSARVVRGGSWNNNGRNVRSANRNSNTPDNRNNNLGFRLALAQQAKIGLNDPIIILSCMNVGKQQDRLYVSNGCGCFMNTCRTVVLSQIDMLFKPFNNSVQ